MIMLTYLCGRPRPAAVPTNSAVSGAHPRSRPKPATATVIPAQASIYWFSVHFLPVMRRRLVSFSGSGISEARALFCVWAEVEIALRIRASIWFSAALLWRPITAASRRACTLPTAGPEKASASSTRAPPSIRISRSSFGSMIALFPFTHQHGSMCLGLGLATLLGNQGLEFIKFT